MIGILPTLDRAGPGLREPLRRRPLHAAQRPDRGRRAARTSPSTSTGVERLDLHLGLDRPGGRLHLRAAAPPGHPGAVRRRVERRAGGGRRRRSRVGANSPFLFGRELWRESRPPLFQQATDTRPPELQAQGVRPRTWFGERWIDSAYDLFEENLRYFPALLPICDDEDPLRVLDDGRRARSCASSSCTTARSTAGTGRSTTSSTACRTCGWRTACCPPGPPSPTCIANAAFYYGLVRALAEEPRPVWSRLPFAAAAANFDAACRYGIDAVLQWPRPGPRRRSGARSPPSTSSATNCCRWPPPGWTPGAIEPADRDFYLGIIEERCRRRVNGGVLAGRDLPPGAGRRPGPGAALAAMTRRYCELMRGRARAHLAGGLPEPAPRER